MTVADDLWWLDDPTSWVLGLGHHRPIEDEEDWPLTWDLAHDEPKLLGWSHSFDDDGLKSDFSRYPTSKLEEWRTLCGNTNVYRTMTLWSKDGHETIVGPFLVDIDNTGGGSGIPDIDDALVVCRAVCKYLVEKCALYPERDIRVYYSGRKGFNVEASPRSLDISGGFEQQLGSYWSMTEAMRREINLGTSSIDPVFGNSRSPFLKHPYVRLSRSMNCWVDAGRLDCKLRLPLVIGDLELTSSEILARSTPT